MDNKAIETLAVNTVRGLAVKSNYLDQYIPDNDKEPFFDGFIYLYYQGGKCKENYRGRVAVQIKGTQKALKTDKAGNIKFPVDTVDLKGYQSEGGVVYFVVWVSRNGSKQKLYYCDLLPTRVLKILNTVGVQMYITLNFKPLPMKPGRLHTLLSSFYDHKMRQSVLHDIKTLPSLDALQATGAIKNMELAVLATKAYHNPIEAFLNEDIYIYAKPNGMSAHYPLGLITDTVERVVSHEVYKKISIGNVCFYNQYSVLHYTGKDILKLGQSITITLPPFGSKTSKLTPKVRYQPCTSLRNRVQDLAFWIAFMEMEGFNVNGEFISFKAEEKQSINVAEDAKKELLTLRKIINALDILHISEDIDLDKLEDKDWHELAILSRAFIDKRKIETLREDLPITFFMNIGRLCIALARSAFDPDGTAEIFDIFDNHYQYGFMINDVQHFAPPCATMDQDSWMKISNIPYDDIQPSFVRIYNQHKDPEIFSVANNTLIVMLLAYDSSHKALLLEISMQMAKWILDEGPDDVLLYSIRLINALQTVCRRRELDKEERLNLLRIAEDPHAEERLRTGAYLLLKNQEAAEMHFQLMDDDTKELFRQWPIYHFWKNKGEQL